VAAQPLALQLEFEGAARVGCFGISLRHPGAAVPNQHGAGAVGPIGDHALEVDVLERMVLDLHREPLLAWIEAWTLRHGPALEHATHLQAEIVMQPPRRMLVDDEKQQRILAPTLRGAPFRLRRLGKIAPAAIFKETHLAGLAAM
jgi:hypothetical protein